MRTMKMIQTISIALIMLMVGIGVTLSVRTTSAQVYGTGMPNLVVTDVTFLPENPMPGDEFTVAVTIRNDGDDAWAVGRVNLYVDPAETPPTESTPLTKRTGLFDALPAGESYPFSFTDSFIAEDGLFPVYVWVDPENMVEEWNETDNVYGAYCVAVGSGTGVDHCSPAMITATPDGSTPTPTLDTPTSTPDPNFPTPTPTSDINTGDVYEPNDACGEATLIEPDGTERVHTLDPNENAGNDEDWFQFEAIAGMTYRFDVENLGMDADMTAIIWANCFTPPLSGGTFTFTTSASQTYYIQTLHNDTAYGSDTAWASKLSVVENCEGYYEPNDSCMMAAHIAPGDVAEHTYCKPYDEDWTMLNVEAGVTYDISVMDMGINASSQVELYESCDEMAYPVGDEHSVTMPYDGQLFIRTENNITNAVGEETSYTVSVVADGSCASNDLYEPNNSFYDSRPIEIGSDYRQTHRVCPAGDVDLLSFSVIAGETYIIETLNLGSMADTVITLFDVGGIEIATNDDYEGLASRITWTAPMDDTYYVEIRHYDSMLAGEETVYDVQVTTEGSEPPPCEPDMAEPDNEMSSAPYIMTNGSLELRNICGEGDEDWFAIDVMANSYVIETLELGDTDVVLALYDDMGTQLAYEDDNMFDGGDVRPRERIAYQFDTAGTYYIKVNGYSSYTFGTDMTYALSVIQSSAPPETYPPAPQMPTTVILPDDTGIDTLIVINSAWMAWRYDPIEVGDMMWAVDALKMDPNVNGYVLDVSENETLLQAYRTWDDAAENENVLRANQVANGIRRVIMDMLNAHGGIEHIVIVGGDEAIPFQRMGDDTIYSETRYDHVDPSGHPTGMALHQNYYLSDDCYADRNMSAGYGTTDQFCLPDLAIGRLVETPAEITNFIYTYLSDNTVEVDQVLVTGYDFVQDGASRICSEWEKHLTGSVNCELIGDTWTVGDYTDARFSTPYLVQSINGHADHAAEGVPGSSAAVEADYALTAYDLIDILDGDPAYEGGLVYSPSCHAGLNVPASNSYSPLDLPQAYAQQGINYVGSTGFGWGDRTDVGLTELLMTLYTSELTAAPTVEMGSALVAAKRAYFSQLTDEQLSELDKKVMQQMVYYGLPMYVLETNGGTQRRGRQQSDPFPSVDVSFQALLPDTGFGGGVPLTLDLNTPMGTETTSDGMFYMLDGSRSAAVNGAFQPLFHTDANISPDQSLRGVVFTGGEYDVVTNFDPVISTPDNEYVDLGEGEAGLGWSPAVPVAVRSHDDIQQLVVPMGQYSGETAQQRVFTRMTTELYYSSSSDQTPPTISQVKTAYDSATGEIALSVNASDEYGVDKVFVAYTDGDGVWQSRLLFSAPAPSVGKWVDTISGSAATELLIQAVDEAGNVAYDTNKGMYYTVASATSDAPNVPLNITLSNQTTTQTNTVSIGIALIGLLVISNSGWSCAKSDKNGIR